MAIDREKLIDKIKSLDGLTMQERNDLVGYLREQKVYGLVWEDKPEAVEQRLRTELPVLKEMKSRAIISETPDAPNHILIEGDNLEALTTLAYTHEGKIDVIYIDPPYNTGNKDFVYNDSYVDREDGYRHSKWLSFMAKRLRIAKKLLSDRGVIFISIDDNEQAQLKLLCDEIFGENRFVANFLWKKKSTTSNVRGAEVSAQTDSTLCYKATLAAKINPRIKSSEDRNYPNIDKEGRFRTAIIEKKDSGAYQRDSMKFQILGHKPRTGKRWQIGEAKARFLESQNRFIWDGTKILLKIYDFEDGDTTSAQPTLLDNCGSTDGAQKLVNEDILHSPELFSNPKPIELIDHLIKIGGQKTSIILDFFAGSGTTLHATMQLNAEDGGKRRCILVTNNENGICENVTYERNRRVIEGYTTPRGEHVPGLNDNNLRYYRTAFVGRRRTPQNMRRLMLLASDMLCIKENIYTELDDFGGMNTIENGFRYFANDEQQMLIIYDETAIYKIVDALLDMQVEKKITTYVFSPANDPWRSEFADVADKVNLTALPAAIYNAYKRVLPKPDFDCQKEETDNEETERLGGLFNTAEEGGEA